MPLGEFLGLNACSGPLGGESGSLGTRNTKFGEENVLAARIDSSWRYRDPGTNSPSRWNEKIFSPRRKTMHELSELFR